MKKKYRHRLLFRVFNSLDAGRKSIYNADMHTTMRWTLEEWENCPAFVIKNCFAHCFKQDGQRGTCVYAKVRTKSLQCMERDEKKYGATCTKYCP